MSVVTRFPPSPTGHLHLGGARTALVNWMFARQQRGKFIVRMEDTDSKRSFKEYETSILNSLAWLGIEPDAPIIRQSERGHKYKQVVHQLLEAKKAYRCICSPDRLERMRAEQRDAGLKPRYDGRCRNKNIPNSVGPKFVVRLKRPETGSIKFVDLIQGNVEYLNSELDDLIIARSDGSPTYHLSSVVDDLESKISHVIRGDDHLNNTPRQIHIYNALTSKVPTYCHIPLLHSADGKKLSKRDGRGDIRSLEADGILSEALVNYLVNIGWAADNGEEIRIKEKLLSEFDITSISKSSAKFDEKKLHWFNQKHMFDATPSSLVKIFETFFEESSQIEPSVLKEVISLYRGRANTVKDMAEKSSFFFKRPIIFDQNAQTKFIDSRAITLLKLVGDRLRAIDEWNTQSINSELKTIVSEHDIAFSVLGQPVRIALSGGTNSPDISDTLRILGRDESLARILFAAETLKN